MEKETRSIALIAGGIIAVAGAVGGWWYYSRTPPSAPAATRAVTATEAPITKTAPAPELPPLDRMDATVRSLLGALSSRPDLVKWLATDNLLNQTALALDLASQGKSPAKDFKLLQPVGSFSVARRGGRRTIDPASYRRYNGLAATLTSLDASAVAKVYRTVKPRLNEAYQKNGHPGGDIDSALNSTLDILLDTPLLDDPAAVKEGAGARWAYADAEIEALQPVQKQLLRMGPDNVDKILVWVRAFQSALRP